MSTVQEKFPNGSFNDVITATGMASLANGSGWEFASVSNTTNLDLDALLMVKIKTGASGVSATGYVNIWLWGSSDNGTTKPDNITGSSAALTLISPGNLTLAGPPLNAIANATTYKSRIYSVAQAFGGFLPPTWGMAVENKTGAAFDSTGSNFAILYCRVQATVA